MRMDRKSRRTHMSSGGGTTLWLSFSDLMSALLLIFVLIMFYIMYQYFEMYETSMAEIARQQADLDTANTSLEEQESQLLAQQSDLETAQSDLATAQSDLETAQADLTTAQSDLAAAQADLETAQAELATAQADLAAAQASLAVQQADLATAQTELETAQADLETAQADLETAQTDLATQQATLDALSITLAAQETQLAAQQETLEAQSAQIEALVGVRARIITSLSEALRQANISATVDPATGAITLESDVLFQTGMSVLSEEGKRRIDAFLPVYLNVLFSDEYAGYVAEIIIEGHTDSVGDYIMNLELSQDRAFSVANYILNDRYTGITPAQKQHLRSIVTANGRSYSDLIYNAAGREDRDASRRVVFKFRLIDEQMIAQLQTLLETQAEQAGLSQPADGQQTSPIAAPETGASLAPVDADVQRVAAIFEEMGIDNPEAAALAAAAGLVSNEDYQLALEAGLFGP